MAGHREVQAESAGRKTARQHKSPVREHVKVDAQEVVAGCS